MPGPARGRCATNMRGFSDADQAFGIKLADRPSNLAAAAGRRGAIEKVAKLFFDLLE
jgi:hypothetical protein